MGLVFAAVATVAAGAAIVRLGSRFYSPARLGCLVAVAVLGWAVLLRATTLSTTPRALVYDAVMAGWLVVIVDSVRARSVD